MTTRLTVGRTQQQRLDLHLVHGSITDVEASAYVLGVFNGVTPTGAASVLDSRLNGAITDLVRRRMFGGDVGQVFMLPAGRLRLATDMVVFAGLGYFDQFHQSVESVQRAAAENVMRVMLQSRVDDFATVLWGGGTEMDVKVLVRSMLEGFVRALGDADREQRFRRITICELNRERASEIRSHVYELAGSALFQSMDVSLTERSIPPEETAAPSRRERAAKPTLPDPCYLLVRGSPAGGKHVFDVSILTAQGRAAILAERSEIPSDQLEKLMTAVTAEGFRGDVDKFGERLAKLVIPEPLRELLLTMRGRPIVVVHDAEASRLPWETLRLGAWSPALDGGLSRRYTASNISVAKYLATRADDERLQVLAVINPTGDLAGAEREFAVVEKSLKGVRGVQLTPLRGEAATREAIRERLESGAFDMVHYAGHAFFDQDDPLNSGLICAGDDVLTGRDAAKLSSLPSLVFFNACEAGRIRRRGRNVSARREPHAAAGLAEALLRGGIANFVGTYWPLGDEPAVEFARAFYRQLASGEPIGPAICTARRAIRKSTADWANYLHYGDEGFRIA